MPQVRLFVARASRVLLSLLLTAGCATRSHDRPLAVNGTLHGEVPAGAPGDSVLVVGVPSSEEALAPDSDLSLLGVAGELRLAAALEESMRNKPMPDSLEPSVGWSDSVLSTLPFRPAPVFLRLPHRKVSTTLHVAALVNQTWQRTTLLDSPAHPVRYAALDARRRWGPVELPPGEYFVLARVPWKSPDGVLVLVDHATCAAGDTGLVVSVAPQHRRPN